MGLSISDVIRLLMLRIADKRRLPFEVKAPNATIRKIMAAYFALLRPGVRQATCRLIHAVNC